MNALIGALPSSWTEHRLESVCEVIAGPSGDLLKYVDKASMRIVTPKDIRHATIAEGDVTTDVPEIPSGLRRYQLAPDDIVSVRTGDIGKHALVDERHVGWIIGTACIRLRANSLVNSRYLLYYLTHPAVHDWIIRRASSTTIPSLTTKTLRDLPVAVPPREIQESIGEVMSAIDAKLVLQERMIATTLRLRETVLPLLFTQSRAADGLEQNLSGGPTDGAGATT